MLLPAMEALSLGCVFSVFLIAFVFTSPASDQEILILRAPSTPHARTRTVRSQDTCNDNVVFALDRFWVAQTIWEYPGHDDTFSTPIKLLFFIPLTNGAGSSFREYRLLIRGMAYGPQHMRLPVPEAGLPTIFLLPRNEHGQKQISTSKNIVYTHKKDAQIQLLSEYSL